YYFGFFLAAIANFTIGVMYGWRMMFAFGGTPALLVAMVRYGVAEPKRWGKRVGQLREKLSMGRAVAELFTPRYQRRTLVNASLVLVSIIGLWAGSVYVPTSVTQLATKAGYVGPQAARLASYATMLLSTGTILGCVVLPPLAELWGRRFTL